MGQLHDVEQQGSLAIGSHPLPVVPRPAADASRYECEIIQSSGGSSYLPATPADAERSVMVRASFRGLHCC